jgi:hypothetical protein
MRLPELQNIEWDYQNSRTLTLKLSRKLALVCCCLLALLSISDDGGNILLQNI